MIVQFSVGNYRSFKDIATFSLEAATDTTPKEHPDNLTNLSIFKLKILKSAVIYGANESGKSNLFRAIEFMRRFILNSTNAQVTSKIPSEPFRLSTEADNKPSYFEIVLVHENIKYRYGFEVNQDQVVSEWLFSTPKVKETRLFTRKIESGIDVNTIKFSEGKRALIERTRKNALFLSTVAQFNGEISQKLISAMSQINIISGLKDEELVNFSGQRLRDVKTKNLILNLLKSIDIDIEDFELRSINLAPDNLPSIFTDEAKQKMAKQLSETGVSIKTAHKKFDSKNNSIGTVIFDMGAQESAGTNKLFLLAAPILDTLEKGKTLFIDEMDSRLHPKIVEYLISLFNSKDKNPKNAQLIFNAHSTLILGNQYFRRDQVWFTQKNRYGASELYSLDDYSIAMNTDFERHYLLGKYGGVPIVNYGNTEEN